MTSCDKSTRKTLPFRLQARCITGKMIHLLSFYFSPLFNSPSFYMQLRGHVRSSVHSSIRRSVLLFPNDKYGCFGCRNSSNDIRNDETFRDNEVVASNIPRSTCFFVPRSCPNFVCRKRGHFLHKLF